MKEKKESKKSKEEIREKQNKNLIPFEPGKSGNPKGRPPGIENSKKRLLRLLKLSQKMTNPVTGEEEDFTVLEQMDMAIIAKARKGCNKSYQQILDRLEGTPTSKQEHEIKGRGIPMVSWAGEKPEEETEKTEEDGEETEE